MAIAVGHDFDAAADGLELHVSAGCAPHPAGTLGIRNEALCEHADRVLQFVDLHAILVQHASGADVVGRDPAVPVHMPGAAAHSEAELVDEGLSGAWVVARQHGAGRRLAHAKFGHAASWRHFGDGAQRRVGDPVHQRARRGGATGRMARNTDHAVLAQQDLKTAERARVGRDIAADDIEAADHRRRPGAGLGEVQSTGLTVDVYP